MVGFGVQKVQQVGVDRVGEKVVEDILVGEDSEVHAGLGNREKLQPEDSRGRAKAEASSHVLVIPDKSAVVDSLLCHMVTAQEGCSDDVVDNGVTENIWDRSMGPSVDLLFHTCPPPSPLCTYRLWATGLCSLPFRDHALAPNTVDSLEGHVADAQVEVTLNCV